MRDKNFALTVWAAAMGSYGPTIRRRSGPISVDPKTIPKGKNQPCKCGSGKKYKKCCLSNKE